MITFAALLLLMSCILPGSLGVIQENVRFSDVGFAGRQILDAKYTKVFDLVSPGSSTSSCASWCATRGNCSAFSIVRSATEGKVDCLITDGAVAGTIAAAGSITYYKLDMKQGSPCITNEQCYSGYQTMTCVSGACRCPAGRMVSSDNTFCFIVDSQGFSYYPDGYAYKRMAVANVTSLSAARTACSALNASSVLPIPYPNKWTHLALTRTMQAGDQFYLGLTLMSGSTTSNRVYLTDNGTMVNSTWKNVDQAQHWATGQPNWTIPADGSAVVMTSAGWDDVTNKTRVNSVVCAKPSTYEYQAATGKFYSMRTAVSMNNSDARAICQSEGGDLAITYGTGGLQVLQLYSARIGREFWVAGTDEAEEGTWVFPDGMSLKVADNDPRSHWEPTQPNAGTSGNCIYAYFNLWGDVQCTGSYGFVCERDA